VIIWSIGALMVLRELEMDITPILTGAGILGLAIGFGAQTLVQDIISGIFLITENQLRVGDAALINGAGGIVEQINLRTVVMRDIDGTVHVIPNGEIRMLANRSKDFAWAVLDLAVSLETETDDAVEAVRAACLDLQRDPAFGLAVLAPLEVLGVDALAESGVTIRFRLKTQPLKQWEIGREWRRRVKKELDARGIRPAHPRLEVTVRNAGGGDSSAITIGR
jgi:small conductance mechanosensitive channel